MKTFILLILGCTGLAAESGADLIQITNRPVLEISAGFGMAVLRSNLVYYSNNVVVVDPPSKAGESNTVLRCEELTAVRGTNAGFDRITAIGNVRIEKGDLHAAGDRAEYDGATEQIRITGAAPMIYSSQFTNRARVIVYDRRTGNIAFEGVRTEVPGASLDKASGTNSVTGSTNKPGSPRSLRFN